MKILKNIGIDIIAVLAVTVVNFLITKITSISMSDMFFWELTLLILASAAAMGLSRREIRRTVRKKTEKEKDKAKKVFLFTEKLSFNFAFIAIIFYGLSLYFV